MYWETYDGSQIRELEGSQQGSIDGMDISTDGSQFVTGGDDKEVLVRQTSILLSVSSLQLSYLYVSRLAIKLQLRLWNS